jgi:polyisoprenoid-binding protein YceI
MAFILLLAAGRGAAAQGLPGKSAPDSTVFVLSPVSVLEVRAGKSGLLSGLGHEHRIRAHAFSGTVVYFPGDPGRSHVTVTVPTDSLRVVPEADSADIPEITRTMREKTLRVDSFPEIRFVSSSVVPLPASGSSPPGSREPGARPSMLRVAGNLTMVGRTRPVSLDMTLKVEGDTLRAEGSFAVKQTDFGIKPFRKALGMVQVRDDVRFALQVVAPRAH